MTSSKKNRVAPSLWFSSILISAPMFATAGETIAYPGNGILATINFQPNSLGPSGSNTGKSTSLSGNSITVDNGGTVGGFVLGGINKTDNSAVTDNRVTVNSGGKVAMEAYGGLSETSAVVSNNAVIIESGGLVRNVYGGRGDSGDVMANNVAINGGTVSGIYGGSSFSGDATDNAVTISSGTVNGNISGGSSFSGNATGNAVNISGGLVTDGIRGGNSNQGVVTNNTVTMNGGQVAGDIYGGKGVNGYVADNTITLSGGVVDGDVYGGYSDNNTAIGNIVTVGSGSDIGYGVHGGWSVNGNTYNNIVNIGGGQIHGTVHGGWSTDGDATGNAVNIRGGSMDFFVYGGYSGSGNATGNKVTISGGQIDGYVYGGYSGSGNTTGNKVTISGGQVDGYVYGGYSDSGVVTGNTVTVSGGQVNQSVYGGSSIDGNAIGNIIILSGGTIMGSIFGGFDYELMSPNDMFIGNTLNVKAKDLSTGGDLKNFQYLNFHIPSTATANATLLNVGSEADLTDGAGGSSIVGVAIAGGSIPLKNGESITLIDAGTLTVNSNINAEIKAKQGLSLIYSFDIVADTANNKLLAIVKTEGGSGGDSDNIARVNPQSKALSEGRLGGVAFVTQGADIVTGIGFQSMESALDSCRSTRQSPDNCDRNSAAFGVIQGSSLRHDTGSHVDVDGVTLMVGAATRDALNLDNLTTGVFFEVGWGNYDSYNSFANAASVHGNGDTNYYGVGLMSRLDMANDIYVDGSFRIGRVDTNFKSGDLIDEVSGQSAHYDSKSTYTGASLGLGKILKLDEQKNLDLYTRYQWMHVNSDSINIFGDTFNLDAINSHRLRAGLRYTQQYSNTSSFYAGAAYDYEFDGEAKGSVYGYRLDAPSLEGGTGILEVGMALKPQNNDRLSVDMGLQGYVGQREGIAGSVKVSYAF